MTRLASNTLSPHSHYWELPIYLGITTTSPATFYFYIIDLHIKVLVLLFISIIRGKLSHWAAVRLLCEEEKTDNHIDVYTRPD